MFGLWLVCTFAFIYWNTSRLYNLFGNPASQDLREFWAAAKVLADKGNPYDLQLIKPYMQDEEGNTAEPLPFYYPFFSFTVLLPFGLLPFVIFRYLYLFILAVVYVWGWLAPQLKALFKLRKEGRQFFAVLTQASVLLVFFPIMLLWWDGGLTIFPLIGLTLFFAFEKKGNSFLWQFIKGIVLSLSFVKLSLCFLIYPFLLIVWLRFKQWGYVWGLALGFLLILIPALLLFPSIPDVMLTIARTEHALLWQNPTVSAFLQISLKLPPSTRLVFSGCALAYSIWYALKIKSISQIDIALRGLILPLSLITVPYAWTYDFVLLLFSISFLLNSSEEIDGFPCRNNNHLYIVLALLAFNLLLSASPLAMEFQWWYPPTILILCYLKKCQLETFTIDAAR